MAVFLLLLKIGLAWLGRVNLLFGKKKWKTKHASFIRVANIFIRRLFRKIIKFFTRCFL